MSRIVHTEETGLYLKLTIVDESGEPLDISEASETLLYLQAPDGTTASGIFEFTVSGTDGKLEYQTQAGDIDQTGVWQYQARVVWSSGVSLVSSAHSFTAVEPLISQP